MIGQLDVKTETVHFYVQRNSGFNIQDAIIPFQLARLNEGGAFNLTSGIFTAPSPGIYHFDFSALKSGVASVVDILLQVNGVNVGHAHTNIYATGSYDSLSFSASLRLASGDRVCLWNNGEDLFDDDRHFTHFTGWLVEEILI